MRTGIPLFALVVALGTLSPGGASALPVKPAAKPGGPLRRTVEPKRVSGKLVPGAHTRAPEVGRDGKIIRVFTGVR